MTTITAPPHASTAPSAAYARLISMAREAHLLNSSGSLLGWDQETLMPARGLFLFWFKGGLRAVFNTNVSVPSPPSPHFSQDRCSYVRLTAKRSGYCRGCERRY